MGDDSLPKRVLATYSGQDDMYEIVPNKGKPFICSGRYRLTLKGMVPHIIYRKERASPHIVRFTEQGKVKSRAFRSEEEVHLFKSTLTENDVFDISINQYLQSTVNLKEENRLFHVGVHFNTVPIPFDPYMIGYWLGDGHSAGSRITTADPEIVTYFAQNLPRYGLQIQASECKTGVYLYNISGSGDNHGRKSGNVMLLTLRDLNMIDNKHIPDVYKMNSTEIRLQVLAGLIDSDGYKDHGQCVEIFQKNDQLATGIEFLAFSLGFMVTHTKEIKSCWYNGELKSDYYNRLRIFGDGMESIPVLLERKKCAPRETRKRATCHGITINPLPKGQYYGLSLEGNGRFLSGDFTVLNAH
ncbi:Hypothetical protein HVR_LOCUS426 [uncultured virus]|nr:Hypothetical protein HVR_LOCUS426 [uncultured virus]